MAVPLIISPCATSAVLPLQELTTQQMVSKVLLYSELNGGTEGLGQTEILFRSASFDNSSGVLKPKHSSRCKGGKRSLPRGKEKGGDITKCATCASHG